MFPGAIYDHMQNLPQSVRFLYVYMQFFPKIHMFFLGSQRLISDWPDFFMYLNMFVFTLGLIFSFLRYPWIGNYRGRDTEEVDVYQKYEE